MKIIGQCVVGAGEADNWLEESLKEFQRLTDDAIIATCNATKKEKDLIKKYGFWQYEDNREWGKSQNRIKETLVSKIANLHPDWILALDADETVPTVDRSILESVAKGRVSTYFYVVNLINDTEHYSEPLSFWNCRYYSLPSEGNRGFYHQPLHCGSAPAFALKQPPKESYVPHILLHKGLMRPADRERKAVRYDQYDPHARWKGRAYYDTLRSEGRGDPFDMTEVTKKITDFCNKL